MALTFALRTPFTEVRIQGSRTTLDVRSVEVEDNDRLIDKATIVFFDPYREYTDFVREGQTVRVDMGWESEHAVLFDGVVVRVEGVADDCNQRHLHVTAFDPATRLNTASATANHSGRLGTIIERVVAARSITIGQIACDPDPEFTEAQPLRQTNETDWRFIQRQAQRYGARAFVEYNEGASRFYFVPESRLFQATPMGELRLSNLNGPLLRFHTERIAAAAAPQRSAATVNPETGATVTTPPPAEPPPDPPVPPDPEHQTSLPSAVGDRYAAAAEVQSQAPSTPAEQRPRTAAAGLPSDPNRPELAARQDPTQRDGLRGRGEAIGNIHLRAKGRVTIRGNAAWDGDWYVRQARHIVRGYTYRTEIIVTR